MEKGGILTKVTYCTVREWADSPLSLCVEDGFYKLVYRKVVIYDKKRD